MTTKGRELFSNLISATGLPKAAVEKELSRVLAESGVDPEGVTLDELRTIMANYLQDVILSVGDLDLLS